MLRVDTIGEIVREDGVFRAELRSPQQALNITRGRVFQGLGDASVGDGRCGVDVDHAAYRGEAIVVGRIDDDEGATSSLRETALPREARKFGGATEFLKREGS